MFELRRANNGTAVLHANDYLIVVPDYPENDLSFCLAVNERVLKQIEQ